MKKKGIIAIVCVFILTLLDQSVKYLINAKMTLGESIPVINNVFHITYIHNSGAAWGSLKGKRIFLLIITVLILAALIYFYIKMLKADAFKDLRVLVIFIISGALGNMIDRIRLGYVIDMFDFCLINFPVFNVADIYVTCSMIILLILIIFKYKEKDFDVLFGKK